MSERKCVFISPDTHSKVIDSTKNIKPKINIGDFVDQAILDKLSDSTRQLDLPFYTFAQHFISVCQKKEDDFCKNILRNYLNREPEIKDFENCERFYKMNIFDEYVFSYNGTPLCRIKRTITYDKVTIDCLPI